VRASYAFVGATCKRFHSRAVDPDDCGRVLKSIEKRDGLLTPEAVLKAAENPKNPLHDAFDWDDGVAARGWRIHQARAIIRSVRVVRTSEPPRQVYVSVSRAAAGEPEAKGRAYYGVDTVRKSEDMINDAIAHLRGKAAALIESARHVMELGRVDVVAEIVGKIRHELEERTSP
jgi:hypothetical protein